jgi:hypothetical protein
LLYDHAGAGQIFGSLIRGILMLVPIYGIGVLLSIVISILTGHWKP